MASAVAHAKRPGLVVVAAAITFATAWLLILPSSRAAAVRARVSKAANWSVAMIFDSLGKIIYHSNESNLFLRFLCHFDEPVGIYLFAGQGRQSLPLGELKELFKSAQITAPRNSGSSCKPSCSGSQSWVPVPAMQLTSTGVLFGWGVAHSTHATSLRV